MIGFLQPMTPLFKRSFNDFALKQPGINSAFQYNFNLNLLTFKGQTVQTYIGSFQRMGTIPTSAILPDR
jgi:hypothetical protein